MTIKDDCVYYAYRDYRLEKESLMWQWRNSEIFQDAIMQILFAFGLLAMGTVFVSSMWFLGIAKAFSFICAVFLVFFWFIFLMTLLGRCISSEFDEVRPFKKNAKKN